MPSDPRKILGREGEDLAAEYLVKAGYRIVDRNFRGRFGEIDLIARRKKELHFIEVKTRAGKPLIAPEEVVDGRKCEKIRKMAQVFLSTRSASRFASHEIYLDVIAIVFPPQKGNPSIKHLVGAF